MAYFSGKINTAYYMSEDYSVIEIVYTDEDQDMKLKHIMQVDPEAQEYKDLVAEGYDELKLIEETAKYKREHAKVFGSLVNAQAQALAEEMLGMKHMMDQKAQLEKDNAELNKTKEKTERTLLIKEKTLLSLDQDVKTKTNKVDHALYDYIRDNNQNKEELFKFKLWALEQDVVKAADKKVKSTIRKATRITEAMAIIDTLI